MEVYIDPIMELISYALEQWGTTPMPTQSSPPPTGLHTIEWAWHRYKSSAAVDMGKHAEVLDRAEALGWARGCSLGSSGWPGWPEWPAYTFRRI